MTGPSPRLPSNRRFGWFFAAIFAAFAAFQYYRHGLSTMALVLGAAAVVLALATVTAPHLLTPLNKAWFALGQLLGRIVSPIVLGFLFFVILTPVALVTRLSGRDELRLKRRDQSSYWIDRLPPGPPGASFKRQF